MSPPRPAAHAARILRLAESPRLGHLLGVNGFFASLARHARTHPGSSLDTWWSEARATKACGSLARPDGLGAWHEHGHRVWFFLEYDTGTETLDRLTAKLTGYHDVIDAGGPACPVLFWLPSLLREANLHRRLGPAPPVLVASATTEAAHAAGAGPADSLWLVAGDTQRRRLAELPATASTPSWDDLTDQREEAA